MGRRILQVSAGVFLGLATVVLLLPLLAPEGAAPGGTPERAGDPHVLASPFPAPRSTLTDQHGRDTPLPGDFDGITVVFFGYTHCPDVCPATMASLAAARARLEPELAERFRAVLVSVDPERDTPERLAAYVGRFDPTFVGLTGSEEELRATADAWGAWAAKAPVDGAEDEREGDATPARADTARDAPADPHAAHGSQSPGSADRGYLVDHTARSFVVDARGRVVATFPPSTAPDDMLPTLRALLDEAG